MRPAGYSHATGNDVHVGDCLRFVDPNSLGTHVKPVDPKVQSWGRFRRPPPGARIIHPSQQELAARIEDRRFGSVPLKTTSAEEVLKPSSCGFDALVEAKKEECYISSKRERLGRRPVTKDSEACAAMEARPGFRGFGIPTVTETGSDARNILYPYCPEDSMTTLHLKPRRHRGVDLAAIGIDKDRHTFGYVPKNRMENEAKECIAPSKQHTSFVKRCVGDQRNYDGAYVGEQPHRASKAPVGMTFGMPTRSDGWGARSCLTQRDEGMRIDDIGISVGKAKQMARGKPVAEPTDQCFGMPTIREDKSKPKNRRVTDNTNYGDDVTVGNLIKGTGSGGNHHTVRTEFTTPLNKAQLKDLTDSARFGLSDEDFDYVWAKATSGDTCTLEAFREMAEALDL